MPSVAGRHYETAGDDAGIRYIIVLSSYVRRGESHLLVMQRQEKYPT